MRKLTFVLAASFFLATSLMIITGAFGQSPSRQKVFTQDIDNFWIAFDSVATTRDSLQQLHYIQTLYIDKGTEGLKSFMRVRNYTADRWVMLIRRYPKFWASVRPNTLAVKTKTAAIEESILQFKALYPGLKDAKLYFTVGGLRSGGTTDSNKVLVGTEIATGDPTTDVSEFSTKWLAGVFSQQSTNNIVPLNIHEYVHTQQRGEGNTLLGQSICEGAADYITELVMGTPMRTVYINYGYQREKELKESFQQEMYTASFKKWLYNGGDATTVADLGYFMGYVICKSYYTHSADKKAAIKEIIELNYSDTTAVESFLKRSAYYTGPIDKAALVAAFQAKQPVVVRCEPVHDGDTLVDASLKTITIYFSRPMSTKGYSFNIGPSGEEHYPLTGVTGYSADGASFIVTADLKPGREYEFVITTRSFSSQDGYPLLTDYPVKFRTKP